ncbi:GntR family transcriptional regulator [Mycolicibacterium vaccae]|uniref:UbiC transcription regulator-associated domain-containing protein n=1 Tax=Mycolicibacterium vaccae ATCC 25954 TaxID=1194972 RepID=K0V158_MYCVA|nr:GntR family transcriptional regulator [Mycolicibacterium vaccae]EJZ12766.1 UbiC transcription regulator-associated domain-containing protein [Mycolicibacterium vaccae ATCC 25954]MCV7061307.1 GntR family transcriptional regulator [Mycolicibacterium vaccae]
MLALEHANAALRRLAEELTELGASRMPTERALADRLQTSRTTVRKALELLENDGTIRRVRGRSGGAYLTKVQLQDAASQTARPLCSGRGVLRSLNTVKGIPEILHEQGFRDGTTVIRSGLVPAPSTVREALHLSSDEFVVSLLRLRHADGDTLSLERMFLRTEVAEVLSTEMKSIYRTLGSQFGVQICAADESIEMAAISQSEGVLLGLPAATPVLKLRRVGYDQHGRALEYSVDLFRADRTRLHVRSQSSPSTDSGPSFVQPAAGIGSKPARYRS